MAVTFKPLHPLLAAEASGVDLSKPLSPALVKEVVAGMDQYAVLVFRGQKLDEDRQIACAKQFGPLDLGLRKIVNNIANQLWHSDSSFQKPAARYSMLHSVVIPAKGGETEFADLRAAYVPKVLDYYKKFRPAAPASLD